MIGGFQKAIVKSVVKEYGYAALKSVQKAYRQTIMENSRRHANPFDEFYKNMENKVQESNVMTRDEAQKILNYKENDFPSHNEVAEKAYDMFEKNKVEKGGTVYLQAKILNAKDYLNKF